MGKKNKKKKENLLKALYKKAVGYQATEENAEYSYIDGKLVMTKRKVAVKDVPPEFSAIKLLLKQGGGEESLDELSEERLILEKERLLALLKEKQDK